MTFDVVLELKKLCAQRCLFAVIYTVGAQFLLLTTYLLFVKFSPFHPIGWFFATIGSIFSWRTWICLVPLIGIVVLHGIVLAKTQLAEHHYYSTRFVRIVKSSGRKLALFGIHVAIGFLTAWLYARFLPFHYTYFYAKCNDGTDNFCLNERYTFIVLNGIYTGIFCFVSNRFPKPNVIEDFPVIQQDRYNELRFKVTDIMYRAVVKLVLVPTVSYIVGCVVFGGIFLSQVAEIFGLWLSPDYTILDGFLVLYMFVIASQIISNIALMDYLMITFLTEYVEFPIADTRTALGEKTCVTLVDGLAADKMPLVQLLAAYDLSTISKRENVARRKQVFALSIPGNHPYNWTALSQQCLAMINAFRIELTNTAESCRMEQQTVGSTRSPSFVGATKFGANSAEMANIILQRQYNETFGMRNMALRQPESEPKKESFRPDPCRRFNEVLERFGQRMRQCKMALLSLPGINYLFTTNETNRLVFLLTTRSSTIDFTINGLISLVEHSLIEDKYGVVQNDLPSIIRTLLQMQTCLEQVIVSFNVQSTSKPRMRCSALLCTVKRSLGKLATSFGEFLPDLLSDPKEVHTMNVYAHLRQT